MYLTFALFYLLAVSHGSNFAYLLVAGLTIFAFCFGLVRSRLFPRMSKTEVAFSTIVILYAIIVPLVGGELGEYLARQFLPLLVAIIALTTERSSKLRASGLASFIAFSIASSYLILALGSLVAPELTSWYKLFFVRADSDLSMWSNDLPRFYSMAAIAFILLPISGGFTKAFHFMVIALPLAPVNILVWFWFYARRLLLIGLVTVPILLLLNTLGDYGSLPWMFMEQKAISIEGRLDKIQEIRWVGQASKDDFSETFWIALAQGVGIIPAGVFTVVFFLAIYRLSKSIRFLVLAAVLSSMNPFPLALIYLAHPLWVDRDKNEIQNYNRGFFRSSRAR